MSGARRQQTPRAATSLDPSPRYVPPLTRHTPSSNRFNKGAVAVTFNVYGTAFCFLSNHFAAHQRKVRKRHADYQRINAEVFAVHDSMKHKLWVGGRGGPAVIPARSK